MANIAIQLPFLLLALGGVYLCIRNGRFTTAFPLIVVIGYFMLLHMAIHAQARYSVQVIPFASVFVAIALRELWARIADRRRGTAVPQGEPTGR